MSLKIKTLNALKRLHRLQLNEKRRQAQSLSHHVESIRQHKQALQSFLAREEKLAVRNAEVSLIYGAYVQKNIADQNRLEADARAGDQKLLDKITDVKTSFRNMKRYEIVEDTHRKIQTEETQKYEQAQLDDMPQRGPQRGRPQRGRRKFSESRTLRVG